MNVWTIQAYDKIDKKTFNLWNVSEVTIEMETEAEALKEAKKIIKRKGYRVHKVWKKSNDQELHEDTMMANLEIQYRLLKILK